MDNKEMLDIIGGMIPDANDPDDVIESFTAWSPDELEDELDDHLDDLGDDKAKRDRIAVQDFMEWMRENEIEYVNSKNVKKHLKYLVRQGYARTTINKSRYYGLCSFADSLNAVTAGQVRDVSCSTVVNEEFSDTGRDEIEKQSREGNGARPIEREEYETLLNQCSTTRMEMLLGIMWDCGFRADEINSLRREDIDSENREITVKNAKRDGYRTVSFSFTTKLNIDEYLDEGYYACGKDTGYVFQNPSSDYPYAHNLSSSVVSLAYDSGIQDFWRAQDGSRRPEISPHSFRKSKGIRMDENGASKKEICETLGHKDVQQMSTYLDID